jgi:hypothetical protein
MSELVQPVVQKDTVAGALSIDKSLPGTTNSRMPDKCVSLRDLGKRYTALGTCYPVMTHTTVGTVGVVFFPSSALLSGACGTCLVSEMARQYAYFTGGLRYLVTLNSNQSSGAGTAKMTAVYFPSVASNLVTNTQAPFTYAGVTASPSGGTNDGNAALALAAMQIAGNTAGSMTTVPTATGWTTYNRPNTSGAIVLSTTTNNYLTLELPYFETTDAVYAAVKYDRFNYVSITSGIVAVVISASTTTPITALTLYGALADDSRFYGFGADTLYKFSIAVQTDGTNSYHLFQPFAINNESTTLATVEDDKRKADQQIPTTLSTLFRRITPQMESFEAPSATPVVSLNSGVLLTHTMGAATVEPTGSIVNKDPIGMGVGDEQQSLERLCSRENYLTTVNWTSSEGFGDFIWGMDLPYDIESYSWSTLLNALGAVLYWRGDFVFTFQLNGTKFHQGMLVANSLIGCTLISEPGDLLGNSAQSVTRAPHVFLDASKSSVGILRVPYTSPYTYNSITNAPIDAWPLAGIALQPFTALSYATGASTSLNVTITVHMENMSFSIPVPNGYFDPPLRRGAVSGKPLWRRKPRKITPQGNTITTNNKFGSVVNSTIPTNITGDALDFKTKLEGAMMDKPTVGAGLAVPVFSLPMANLCSSVGMLYAERMALDPSGLQTVDLGLARTDVDEMSIAYLASIMCFQKAIAWDVTSAISTNLWQQPIMPCFNLVSAAPSTYANPLGIAYAASTSSSTVFTLSPLDFVACRFCYWSGALRFQFQMVTSGLHTGRLWISLNYGVTPPQNLPEAMQQYGVMIDLSEEARDFIVEVPFKFWAPRCRNPIMTAAFPTNAIIPSGDSYTGFIGVWVVNPLVAPPGVATAVTMNVLMAAGPDFEVGAPAPCNMSIIMA